MCVFRAPGHSLPRLGARLTSAGEILALASCCDHRRRYSSWIDRRIVSSPLLTSSYFCPSGCCASLASVCCCCWPILYQVDPIVVDLVVVIVWPTDGTDRWSLVLDPSEKEEEEEEVAAAGKRAPERKKANRVDVASVLPVCAAPAAHLYGACVLSAWRSREPERAEEGEWRTRERRRRPTTRRRRRRRQPSLVSLCCVGVHFYSALISS